MKRNEKSRLSSKELDAMQRSDKRKLVFMSLLLGVLCIAFIVSKLQEKKYEAGEDAELEAAAPMAPQDTVERIVMPNVDLSQLDKLVNDSSETKRSLLESAGLDMAVDYRASSPAITSAPCSMAATTRVTRRSSRACSTRRRSRPWRRPPRPRAARRSASTEPSTTCARRTAGPTDPEETVAVVTLEDGARAHVLALPAARVRLRAAVLPHRRHLPEELPRRARRGLGRGTSIVIFL